jgi:hypothetical protein
MTCPHDFWERETSVADGYCPICMEDRINELVAVLEKIADLRIATASAIARSALDTMRLLK